MDTAKNEFDNAQIDNVLQVGTKLEDINIEFRLSLIKPLNGKWLVQYYNHTSSQTGTKVIANRFKLADIYDSIGSGKSSLKSISPFNDIAPLADSLSEGNHGSFVQLSDDLRKGYVFESEENESENDEDTEWSLEDVFNRNIFDDFTLWIVEQSIKKLALFQSLIFCFL